MKNDYVTRNSHNNDVVFKIIEINDNIAILKGINIRLIADSSIDDLKKIDTIQINDDEFINKFNTLTFDRDDYFYLPGRILHIDSDKNYLDRCLNFYSQLHIKAKGLNIKESSLKDNILTILENNPCDILVITGHDAFYPKKGDEKNLNNYKNSYNFVEAIKKIREKYNHQTLIIIAGACQSNYEELIKAGANFASSPKRINIHALDPAIIASSIALSEKNKTIDLITILNRTKYGPEGIGGIIGNGTMYVGYPR